jgi:hypothetical protein
VEIIDLLMLDLTGHGASTKEIPSPFEIEVFGYDVLSVITDYMQKYGRGVSKFVTLGVGHSIGSTALQFAEVNAASQIYFNLLGA